jgi:prepilin-type N-terminal cleavage/methylation domain-containing protein
MDMKSNRRGYTLVELIVVMAIFTIVIMISADAFKTILTQASKIFRSEESNVEGIVGLEMMRHDLQQAGLGLYTETNAAGYTGEAAVAPASSYNEPSLTAAPRAVVFGNNIAAVTDSSSETIGKTYLLNTDYIGVKATSVGRTNAGKKWTYLKMIAGQVEANTWGSTAENLTTSERVILLRRTLNATSNTLTLEPATTSPTFYHAYSPVGFQKYSTSYTKYVMYGIDNNSGTTRMPFNRTDYFVARPLANMPTVCAPGTGNLYKAVVNQSNGNLTYYPVLDCVADMQIVLGWDLRNGAVAGTDGLIDTWSNANGSIVSQENPLGVAAPLEVQAALADSVQIRESLKMIKVFVLAQNGRRDTNYTSPTPITVGDVNQTSLASSYNISAAALSNYRWKVYRIVVRPKNLLANQ